jgi:hypothetical protein
MKNRGGERATGAMIGKDRQVVGAIVGRPWPPDAVIVAGRIVIGMIIIISSSGTWEGATIRHEMPA